MLVFRSLYTCDKYRYLVVRYPVSREVDGAERLETELEALGARFLGVGRRDHVVAGHIMLISGG